MDAEMARRHVNEQSAPPRPWILVLRMTAGTWRSDSSALPKYGVGGANLTTAGCDGAAWLPASHAIGGELAHANQVFDGMPMREAKERWVVMLPCFQCKATLSIFTGYQSNSELSQPLIKHDNQTQ